MKYEYRRYDRRRPWSPPYRNGCHLPRNHSYNAQSHYYRYADYNSRPVSNYFRYESDVGSEPSAHFDARRLNKWQHTEHELANRRAAINQEILVPVQCSAMWTQAAHNSISFVNEDDKPVSDGVDKPFETDISADGQSSEVVCNLDAADAKIRSHDHPMPIRPTQLDALIAQLQQLRCRPENINMDAVIAEMTSCQLQTIPYPVDEQQFVDLKHRLVCTADIVQHCQQSGATIASIEYTLVPIVNKITTQRESTDGGIEKQSYEARRGLYPLQNEL